MFTIHVAHAVFLSERSRDAHRTTALHELPIAGEPGNYPSDELGAFAIRQIEPPACRGGYDEFGAHQTRIE